MIKQNFTPSWAEHIRFAFSQKADGQMSFKRADPVEVANNRRVFLNRHLMALHDITAAELIHSSGVKIVTSEHRGQGAFSRDWQTGMDGMVTNDPGVLLLTTHADCPPIVIFDPKHQVLGQAHAGWRSLAAGIVVNLVAGMSALHSEPVDMLAWVGPCIRPCCFQVGFEVATLFPRECRQVNDGRYYLDLPLFIGNELISLGFSTENISTAGICTSCDPAFSSFRRDGDEFSAMACVSGLR